MANSFIQCHLHKQENYKLYCTTCKDCVCFKCVQEFHDGHHFCKVENAVLIVRSEIETRTSSTGDEKKVRSLDMLKEHVRCLDNERRETKIALKQLSDSKEQILSKLNTIQAAILKPSCDVLKLIENGKHLNKTTDVPVKVRGIVSQSSEVRDTDFEEPAWKEECVPLMLTRGDAESLDDIVETSNEISVEETVNGFKTPKGNSVEIDDYFKDPRENANRIVKDVVVPKESEVVRIGKGLEVLEQTEVNNHNGNDFEINGKSADEENGNDFDDLSECDVQENGCDFEASKESKFQRRNLAMYTKHPYDIQETDFKALCDAMTTTVNNGCDFEELEDLMTNAVNNGCDFVKHEGLLTSTNNKGCDFKIHNSMTIGENKGRDFEIEKSIEEPSHDDDFEATTRREVKLHPNNSSDERPLSFSEKKRLFEPNHQI